MILHFDLDAFFAAVEVLLDPSLAGKPLVVGADPRERGVVATASYEARAFGIHSALPIGQAYRLCPDAVFVRPRHGVYSEYSRRVFAVVGRFSDRVQPLSVDEAFVALPADDYLVRGRAIKQAIRDETGLVASVGISASKLVSKIASGTGKPDGFVFVPPGYEADFLAPLPIRELWGVGPKTGLRLAALGIATIGDLAGASREALAASFGARYAAELQGHALGMDDRQVETERTTKSMSDEHTFQRDESDSRQLWGILAEQCENLARRAQRKEMLAKVVTVKLRYADFETITRSLTLPHPTDEASLFREAIVALMRQNWADDRRKLRLIGVRLSGLVGRPTGKQLRLML